ncbi:hypothetical protein LK09_15685 [Microbacterium mangrovi]|uniref:Uncharacterized protein n=1 Tax=Microbacterium mangrovi TaxID=1348253 RepID=A0A0B2A3P2_9MICO|nr:hypothetical protein [Microbacterium mangrovi]KHK96404.1 hypothetical protein LK09_15685 [Microbacterium mangrovi]
MTASSQHEFTDAPRGPRIQRRTLLKGAAWSVPILAATVAAPAQAASTVPPTIAWSGTKAVTDFEINETTKSATSQVPVTVPLSFVITNGSAPQSGLIDSLVVTFGAPSGAAAPTDGTAYGLGVFGINGSQLSVYNQPTYGQAGTGFPTTTWTHPAFPLNAGADQAVTTMIEFILVGTSSAGPVTDAVTFPVTVTATIDGVAYADSTTITVPAGALLL